MLWVWSVLWVLWEWNGKRGMYLEGQAINVGARLRKINPLIVSVLAYCFNFGTFIQEDQILK